MDALMDDKWMVADTPQMRVLRAYVLIGSITRLAETKFQSEREIIIRHVNTAIKVASEAYYCAYSQPGRCVFFDERMVEFEVSVLRLFVAVISNRKDEDLFEAVGRQLVETFPLLKAADSLSKMLDAITATGEAVINASRAIQAVLKVGQTVYFKGRRLGAIYRDSIELNMIAVLSSLDAMCAVKTGEFIRYLPATHDYAVARLTDASRRRFEGEKAGRVLDSNIIWAIETFYGNPEELPDGACEAFRRGHALWKRGSGDLSAWVDFLNSDAAAFSRWIVPTSEAFIQASDLIWRACEHLTSDISELSDCIGRRPPTRGLTTSEPLECAIKFDSDGLIVQTIKKLSDDLKKRENSIYRSFCRLILYEYVVALREDRRARSNARLYWLSHLTPLPSHPIRRHPGQY